MAVDKNSKAYQSLQKSGYSDEQISQMHQQVAQGNTPQSVVSGNPKPQTPMVDPIAYRPQNNNGMYDKYIEGWDPKKLNNADINLSQYGDDSSAPNYNQSELRGGKNQKYTGENTLGSQIPYNKDATIEGLDPNYLYGQSAQMQNSQDPNYIARRNDEIASALYNEGKVTVQDVADFLSKQNQWDYSNENERQNTIMSVWKRIGQIAEQNKQQEPEQGPAEEEAKPGMDLEENEGGVIYGRAGGDKGTRVETLADPNSPEAISLRARQMNYQSLQSMDSYNIAVSLASGMSLYGEQAMRDLSQYDPQKYQEIQTELKKIQQGETVNAIASGEKGTTTAQADKATDVINDSINKWTESNSTERTRDQVEGELTSKLENSQTAQTATQEMLNLKAQMAEIEEKMENLPNEAKKAFKGDVPQYIIDAYVANNSQRLQSELNKLQSRYNGAIELYKTELAQKQWEVEMDLKQRQYNFDVSQAMWERNFKTAQQAWENDYKTKSLALSAVKTDAKGNPYIINADGTYEYLTNATYTKLALQQKQQIQDGLNQLNSRKDGSNGGQCEAFSDSWNNTVYGQTMLPVDQNGNIISGRNFTYAWEKDQYVNTSIPAPGLTAIFDYSGISTYSKNAQLYGHTMIVTAYDPATGMITLRGSNKDGKEKVYTSTMNIKDFFNKYHGQGFWDPTQPTRFQQEQSGAVNTSATLTSMNDIYGELITNASTEGKASSLSTAQTMYNVLAQIRDDGSLEHLIESGDLEKIVNSFKVNKFTGDDGGNEFAKQLRDALSKKVPDSQSQIALNKLLGLVEMKLRKESGAAISSTEWLSNFERMIPSTYEDMDVMRAKLTNRDDIIRMYSVAGGMGWDEYQPLFNNEWQKREIF